MHEGAWAEYLTATPTRTLRRHPDGVNALIDLVNQADGFAPLADLVQDGGRAASSLGAAEEAGLAGRNITATNVMASADARAMARLAELVATPIRAVNAVLLGYAL